ncbi:hypothetical protein HPB50_003652 [Hyalomma asiaticum]|uniref:Uncharacterized protein n=1 Tax=Hyalomma asiaticum TaxID=266040 RepID=A0ACB7RJT5_HYAAI|nr:hypothetical protein HPB50_003652 [Hyalomma asiaticum]
MYGIHPVPSRTTSFRRSFGARHALYPVDIVYYKNPRNGEPRVYVFAKQVGAHLDPNERRKLVVLEVTGWMPYMFLKVEDDDVQKMERTVREFLKKAHQSLQDAGNINFKHTIDTSSDLKFLDGYGYRPDDAKERFIKVSISDPKVYKKFAQIVPYKAYMAQVDHVCQFTLDVGLAHPDKLLLLGRDFDCVKDDPRILHLKTSVQNLSVIDSDGKEAPTLKAMSIAIKCTSKSGRFPKSHKKDDSIIQITSITTADVLRAQPGIEDFQKCVFVLGSCDFIDDADVRCYDGEKEMLEAFREHVVSTDPDIITGYKVRSFDWPYILDRFKIFQMWAAFSRRPYGGIWSHYFNGNKEVITSHDRILLDMCDVVTNERSLRSDSLHSIVKELSLYKEPWNDLECSKIKKLHEGTAATRAQLASDCVRCALIPMKLMIKLKTVRSILELSNITGVPMRYVYDRGVQVRVMTLIAREASTRRMVFPTNKEASIEQQLDIDEVSRAKVLEPLVGYYNDPVCTLDFASLYPTIIIAMNLCYCTLRLHPQQQSGSVEGDKDEDEGRYEYRQGKPSPEGDEFEPESVRKGVLPTILVDLLNARKEVKQEMAKCEDPFQKDILNERQLAIKKCANSVYGFTGARKYPVMPCVEIARSVTAYGRTLMDKTIHCVEKKYTKHEVIYGDTDSVMIHYTGKTVAEAMQMGKELAGLVSSGFPPPITLEFETVYKPYLLVGKKKYAGGMYSSSSDSHKEVVVKGLDCIRRDCLPYAARIMDDCIKHIFDKADIDAALQIATEAVSKLRSGSVDSELTLTKTYNGKKSKIMQPHLVVIKKQIGRGEEAARAGDGIPYVICKELVTDEAELRREYEARREEFSRVNLRKVAYRAEDPQYVQDHGLPIDYAYYEELLMRSLNTLFEPMHRAIEVP